MGEGILVIMASVKSLGGNSKHLLVVVSVVLLVIVSVVVRAVHGLGLPGSSSHLNGTEAVVVWSGGVSIPGCCGDCICGIFDKNNNGSFGTVVELI